MSKLIEAAKQALEVFTGQRLDPQQSKAITALRSALESAESVEQEPGAKKVQYGILTFLRGYHDLPDGTLLYATPAVPDTNAALIIEHHETTIARMKDAARYRWLREQNASLDNNTFYVGIDNPEPDGIHWIGVDLDAAIDAAMEQRA